VMPYRFLPSLPMRSLPAYVVKAVSPRLALYRPARISSLTLACRVADLPRRERLRDLL
jgi:hypothetical protein